MSIPVTSYALPFRAGGIAFDGSSIWTSFYNAAAPGVDSLIKINPATGAATSFNTPTNGALGPNSLVCDFSSVWVLSPVSSFGTSLHLWQFDSSGSLLNDYDLTPTSPTFINLQGGNIVSDGTNLWVTFSYTDSGFVDTFGVLLKVDPADGSILATANVGQTCCDAAVVGANIWTANQYDGTIAEVRRSDGAVLNTYTIVAGPEFSSDMQNIVYDGTNLWIVDAFNFNLFKVDLGGTILDTISLSGAFPFGMIFDSGNLWLYVQAASSAFEAWKLDLSGATVDTASLVDITAGGISQGQAVLASDGTRIWVGTINTPFLAYAIGASGCHCSSTPDLPNIEAWYVVHEASSFVDRSSYLFMGEGAQHTFNLQTRSRGTASYTLRVLPGDSYLPTRGSPIYLFDQNRDGFTLAFAGVIQDYTQRWVGIDGLRYIDVNAVTFEYIFDTVYVTTPLLYEDKTAGFIARDLLCRFACGTQVVAGTIEEDGDAISRFNANVGDKLDGLFDQLATTVGKIWFVDLDAQSFNFQAPSTTAAPFTINSVKALWDSINVQLDGADYRNRQGVKLDFDAFAHSCEFFVGADQQSFTLARPVEQVTNAWATLSTCNTATGTFTGQPSDGDTVTISIPAGAGFGWQASHAYALDGVIVVDGFVQKVTTAGTSGGSQPTFSTVTGDTTIDNTVIWTCQGPAGLATGDQTYTFRTAIDNTLFGEVLIGATDADTAQNLMDAINATAERAGAQIRGVTFSLPTWENSLCNAIDLSGLSFTLEQKHAGTGWLSALAWTGTAFSFDSDVTFGGTSPQGSLGPGEGATISLQVYVRGTSVAAPGLDYVPGSAEIHLATPLNTGSNLNVEYTRADGNVIQVERTDLVAALAAVTHGNGKVQQMTDQAQTGLIATSAAAGLQFAQEALAAYDVAPNKLAVELHQPGLRPGQTLTLALNAPLNVLNGEYFIEEIQAQLVPTYPYLDNPNAIGAGHYRYTARVISVTNIQSWLDFWKDNLGGGGSIGAASGGSVATSGGGLAPPGTGVVLKTDGATNTDQALLNLAAGTNITLTDNGSGTVTIDATGGGSGTLAQEAPSGALNGSNVTFVLAHTPLANSLTLAINGVIQLPGTDFTLSTATITMAVAPVSTDWIRVWYQY